MDSVKRAARIVLFVLALAGAGAIAYGFSQAFGTGEGGGGVSLCSVGLDVGLQGDLLGGAQTAEGDAAPGPEGLGETVTDGPRPGEGEHEKHDPRCAFHRVHKSPSRMQDTASKEIPAVDLPGYRGNSAG